MGWATLRRTRAVTLSHRPKPGWIPQKHYIMTTVATRTLEPWNTPGPLGSKIPRILGLGFQMALTQPRY